VREIFRNIISRSQANPGDLENGHAFLGTLCKATGHIKKISLKSPYFSPTDYFGHIVFEY